MLCGGEVVAWFNGRAEFGPRALGNRSLLADPRRADMVDTLNRVVKRRESFRPFAPSCLAPHVPDLFGCDCASPYMTITMPLVDPARLPAAAHVDGTARLQTLARDENPAYYDLIDAFRRRTRTPALLNTSFNVAGEPIVHSPADALRALLGTDGIGAVAFPEARVVVRARASPPSAAGDGDAAEIRLACGDFRSEVVRSSTGDVLRVSVLFEQLLGDADADADDEEPEPELDDELSRTMSVELGSAEELEVLELIAGADEPTTVAQLFQSVAEDDGWGEGGGEGGGAGDDERQLIRDLVHKLWRRRLVTVLAPAFTRAR
jgi:hypothetical protein